MLRHGIYRGRYLLHIFQQNGYKSNELLRWLFRHWNTVLVPVPHLALILVTMIVLTFLEPYVTKTALTVALVIFGSFWFGNISQYDSTHVKKPLVFTPRMIRLAAVYTGVSIWIPLLGTSFALYRGMLFPDIYILIFVWMFADLILPYVLFLAAALIYPVERFIQYRFKVKARNKLAEMPELTVVAITGSYGKTSTKFLIDAVLKERFRVCTTPGSYNTPMGICKVINQDLQPSDQILILEMGARYVGNIDELCRIARPDIAVVTNVGVAHLESFGSLNAIARTKGALIRHLKPGGTAILNGDDPEVRKMADRNDITTIFAGLSGENNHIFARNIGYDELGCTFDLQIRDTLPSLGGNAADTVNSGPGNAGKQTVVADHAATAETRTAGTKEQIRMSILGEHSVQNALLAAGSGVVMNLRLPTIKVALRKVAPVPHRLELKKQNGIVIIDDAFNSNPVGAKNAISVLSAFRSGRKFVVTPGMVELGSVQDEENRKFGAWMAKHKPDHVYLVGEVQTRPIYEGLKEGGFSDEQISVVGSLFEANDLLRTKLREGDVVLYENDLPDSYSE